MCIHKNIFIFLFLLTPAVCFPQSNPVKGNKDSLFYAGLNTILNEIPNDFKKFRGKEFFENNGIYYQRFTATYSLPDAAKSMITVQTRIGDAMECTFHVWWHYPLKDSLIIRKKADSLTKRITDGSYDCCQRIHAKNYSNKENYCMIFFSDGKKAGMHSDFENVYLEIRIEKGVIRKGVKGLMLHLEIRKEELPKGSEN